MPEILNQVAADTDAQRTTMVNTQFVILLVDCVDDPEGFRSATGSPEFARE